MSTGNAYLFNALVLPSRRRRHRSAQNSGHRQGRARKIFSREFPGRASSFFFPSRLFSRLVLLDFIVIGFGYYRPLLPIFAKDILFVGPAGFGMLSSAPAIGGVLGTFALLAIGDVKSKGLLALWSFLAYAIALGVFAISTNFWLSLFLLAHHGTWLIRCKPSCARRAFIF